MILAIDFGKKRFGYAYGEIQPSNIGVTSKKGIEKMAVDLKPSVIVVGLPLSMSGRYSCQTFESIDFAKKLKDKGFDVRMVDERLSTKIAHEILRKSKSSKPVDAVSASLIFENFIRNPDAALKIPDDLPKFDIDHIDGKRVLIHNIPDVSILDRIKAKKIDVLQENPYIAYLFKKRVNFVERFEEFLEGDYDIIITAEPEKVENLLSRGGKIVCP